VWEVDGGAVGGWMVVLLANLFSVMYLRMHYLRKLRFIKGMVDILITTCFAGTLLIFFST
jgi:hypothetical protein